MNRGLIVEMNQQSLTPSFCSRCGARLQADANFCQACGAPVEKLPSASRSVSEKTEERIESGRMNHEKTNTAEIELTTDQRRALEGKRPLSKSYIARHWRGELSLPRSLLDKWAAESGTMEILSDDFPLLA